LTGPSAMEEKRGGGNTSRKTKTARPHRELPQPEIALRFREGRGGEKNRKRVARGEKKS